MAYRYAGGVNETDAGTPSLTEKHKKHHHRNCDARLHLDKASIRQLVRKLPGGMLLYIEKIIVLEIAETVEMKAEKNCDYLTVRHPAFTVPFAWLAILVRRGK